MVAVAHRIQYKLALLMFMVHDNLSRVSKRIRSTNCQQPGTSTASFYQQPTSLFHGQELTLETEPSLLPVRQYGTVCPSLSEPETLASFKRTLNKMLSYRRETALHRAL